jgi:hypothetical protein
LSAHISVCATELLCIHHSDKECKKE